MDRTNPEVNGVVNGDIRDDEGEAMTNKEELSEAERNLSSSQVPFYKFVLTGGPCGGKYEIGSVVFLTI